jgi:hypothetical protein
MQQIFDRTPLYAVCLPFMEMSNHKYSLISKIKVCRLWGCYVVAAFVRTDVSEDRRVSIIRVTGIGVLERTLAVTRSVVCC